MQMLLKESKYIEKDKKKVRYISDDPEISSDDSDKGQIKTKYHVKSFLTRYAKQFGHEKVFKRFFFVFWPIWLCFKA